MRIKPGVTIFLLVTIILVGCGSDKNRNPVLNIIPGKYRVTVVRDDFDGQGPKGSTQEQCFSAEEYHPFKERYDNENCVISNFDRIGSSVKYDIECKKDLETALKGKIAYGYIDEKLRWSYSASGTTKTSVYSFEVNGEALLIGECEVREEIKAF